MEINNELVAQWEPKIQKMFAKSQGIYLESGLVEVQNGSYSKKADKFALVQL